jgi:predicted nucleotide-binding protein
MADAQSNHIREELHLLLDHIPDADVQTARKVLRALVDPVELAVLLAPPDDEPVTEEERAAVEASLIDPSPDVPFEQIRRVRA